MKFQNFKDMYTPSFNRCFLGHPDHFMHVGSPCVVFMLEIHKTCISFADLRRKVMAVVVAPRVFLPVLHLHLFRFVLIFISVYLFSGQVLFLFAVNRSQDIIWNILIVVLRKPNFGVKKCGLYVSVKDL